MNKPKLSQWRKLDNAALAFPAVTSKKDSRVFRFYCQLKEEIDREILQKALDKTMEKYQLFQMVLRKGLFWFYLEHRELRAEVKEEETPPCSRIYIPDKKSLLFEVSYHKNRINFEVFHALTDGTGAMHFLQELVKNYLFLAHPEKKLPELSYDQKVTPKDLAEDSFSQYYNADMPKIKEKKEKAYQFKGEMLDQKDMEIAEIYLPVKETLAKAREYHTSITVLLAAMLICAIHEEVPKSQQKKPIGLMIPVNLRKYFPSDSMANFFGWIEVNYHFKQNTVFQDVVEEIKSQFEKELSKERIGMRMNDLVRLEKHPILRIVPLEVKSLVLQAGTVFGGRSITAVYSNVGIIQMPEEYKEFISRFGIFASTNGLQVCSCSYGEELVLDITTKIPGESIQRNMVSYLEKEEIPCTYEKNNFPGYKKETRETAKKFFDAFTFICIAVAVICGMANYMFYDTLSWSWFVTAGCFCTWLIVVVAFMKRRNILKNLMWQLIIVTAAGILWDFFTGWRGWSVDFLLPLASLAVLCSMPVIAKVKRMERPEYLFYLIQAGAYGWIPMILVLTGTVKVTYPSVLCSGISFLVIAGLFIFLRRELMKEFQKKLRI